jgi:cytochrome oxidase Cu insertion factor (SCO1/SenC/PrrC family)
MWRYLAVWIALAIVAVGSSAAGQQVVAEPAPVRFEPPLAGSYSLPRILQVDDYSLLDPRGQPAPLLGLAEGELALVSFVYLSCGEACPMATASLHRLDRALAEDSSLAGRVQLVSVSFDPQRDTPDKLAALERSVAPRARWRFLTARNPAEIVPVLADFGQDAVRIPNERDPAQQRLRHVLKLFLVDSSGGVRNIYSTGTLDLRLILGDLRTLLGAHS